MVRLRGETSNTLFETLEDWSAYLQQEKVDFDNLSPGPAKLPAPGPKP